MRWALYAAAVAAVGFIAWRYFQQHNAWKNARATGAIPATMDFAAWRAHPTLGPGSFWGSPTTDASTQVAL